MHISRQSLMTLNQPKEIKAEIKTLKTPAPIFFSAQAPQANQKKAPLLGLVSMLALFSTAPLMAQPTTSPFDKTEILSLVSKICADSETQPFAIVDSFNTNGKIKGIPLDMDGDAIADMSHGNFIDILYQSNGKTTQSLNLKGNLHKDNMMKTFNALADQLEAKSLNAAAINVSLAIPLSFAKINRTLELPFKITPQNLAENRAEILDAYQAKYPRNTMLQLIPAFQRIANTGTPILLAAGNTGSGSFNLISLFPGTLSIGALDSKGEKKMAYSADHSLVSLWRSGEYFFKKLANGDIDMNNDQIPDISKSELSNQESIPSQFAGKKVTDVLKSTPPYLVNLSQRMDPAGRSAFLQRAIPQGIYKTSELTQLYGSSPTMAEKLQAQGKFLHSNLKHAFKADETGLLTYDPEGSGDPNQVATLGGSSFAPANICQ